MSVARRIRRVMRPDAQGRLSVGAVAGETQRFAIEEHGDGSLTLTPTDQRTVDVDSKNRINLAGLVTPGELYEVRREQDGSLTLTPVALTPIAGKQVRVHGGYTVAPTSEEEE